MQNKQKLSFKNLQDSVREELASLQYTKARILLYEGIWNELNLYMQEHGFQIFNMEIGLSLIHI